MRSFLIALFTICISGCFRLDPLPSDHVQKAFKDQYADLAREYKPAVSAPLRQALVTFSGTQVPFQLFLRTISDQSRCSIIASKDLDNELVSLEVKEVPFEAVLGGVARRLGQRLTQIGNVWYIGQISPEDRATLVRRVRRLDLAGLKSVLDLFRSEFGRSETFSDGLVVASDRVEILDRISTCLDRIEATESVSWVAQLYLVSMTSRFKQDLGIDLTNSVKFSWNVNSSTGQNSTAVAGTLDALLVAAWDSPEAQILAQPLLLVRDGSTASLISGESVPVPRKTVSPEGNVQTVGFDNVQTGYNISVNLRDQSQTSALGKFKIEWSQITGYLELAPIVRRQVLETDVSLESGGVYLLGSLLDSQKSSNQRGKILPSIFSVDSSQAEIQIFCKVYRIGGSFVHPPAAVLLNPTP